MFGAMEISSSALSAIRTQMDVIASNIANIETTRNDRGESIPYRRREVVFAAGRGKEAGEETGVHVAGVVEDLSPFRMVPAPGHPDADENGNVLFPNVDLQREVVNAVVAMRAYEANVAAFEASKQMMAQALRLIG